MRVRSRRWYDANDVLGAATMVENEWFAIRHYRSRDGVPHGGTPCNVSRALAQHEAAGLPIAYANWRWLNQRVTGLRTGGCPPPSLRGPNLGDRSEFVRVWYFMEDLRYRERAD